MSNEKRCGEQMRVMSRVVGFYSEINNWNKGKREEFKMRKTYDLNKAAGGNSLYDPDNKRNKASIFKPE